MIKLKKKPAMVCVIKKEEDFIPFQQTFVNVSDTKEEEIYNVADFSESDQQTFVNVSDSKKEEINNVSDFSESDPLNTKYYISQIYLTTDYGRPMKAFVIKTSSNFLAWTDKFGGIWGILSQFISTHFQPILVL
jgi:hypothetical protein